jgi:FkbM family methyltransferase
MRPYYYLGGNWALTQLSNGLPFFVNTNDRGIATWIILGGTWENFVDDVLCALARPGQTFIDVGANLGYYTIKIGNLVGPSGRVFSFEPNPELFPFLAENIIVNGFSGRATAHRLAAGAATGHSTLQFTYSNMGGGHVAVPGGTPGTNDVTVGIVRLDDILPPDQAVDLIKIDAEGFEPLIFQGMEGVLTRSPEAAIVTEISINHWERFGDPLEILDRVRGTRRTYLIGHDGKLTLVASSDLRSRVSRAFVSYVLLLPDRMDLIGEIQRFL